MKIKDLKVVKFLVRAKWQQPVGISSSCHVLKRKGNQEILIKGEHLIIYEDTSGEPQIFGLPKINLDYHEKKYA
jgi:hypothetical protein